MKETLKAIAGFFLAALIMVGVVLVVMLFIKGGVWLSAKIYPWLSVIAGFALIITLLVLLPLAAFRKSRAFAGSCIYIVSYVFGATLWVWGLLLTYTLWGGVAVFIGLFLMGVGVVPLAMLATLFKTMWSTFGGLLLLAAITFGARFLGIYVLAKAEDDESVIDLEQIEPPLLDEQPLKKQANYFVRHWRGELSLGVSYWANGILAYLFIAVAAGCVVALSETTSLRTIAAVCILLYALSLLASFWQVVGIWRSASKHAGRGGQQAWAVLAKFMVILGVLRLVGFTTNTIVPQTVGFWNIITGDTRISAYEIRVLPGGNEVEFHGGLRAGSAKELERILNAVPQAKVLHVNSIGGRIREAESMARLVRDRGLITYTSEECLSAATLVFIAGRERVVEAKAKLGFHGPSFPGLTDEQRQAANESNREMMRTAGISDEFIKRVLATPSSDMWYPSLEEMLRARVVTSQSFGERFAVSGSLLRHSSPQELDEAFSDLPGFRAIKELEPATYQKMLNELSTAIQSGKSQVEAQNMVGLVSEQLMVNYLPRASDEALLAMRDFWIEILEKFKDKDSQACIAMFSPKSAGPDFNYGRVFSEWSSTSHLVLIEKVLRSATKGVGPQLDVETADKDLATIWSKLGLIYGDDFDLLSKEGEWMQHSGRVCEILLAYYKETQKIPRERQSNLVRYLLSDR